MQTSDGQWLVEAVRRGTSRWYRITHDSNTIDWLSIAGVERILVDAGVDLTTLTEVNAASARALPGPSRRIGVRRS